MSKAHLSCFLGELYEIDLRHLVQRGCLESLGTLLFHPPSVHTKLRLRNHRQVGSLEEASSVRFGGGQENLRIEVLSSEAISLSVHNRTDGYPTRLPLKITSHLGSGLTHAQGFLLAPSLPSLGSALPLCGASLSSTRDPHISARQVGSRALSSKARRTEVEAKLDQGPGFPALPLHLITNVREDRRTSPHQHILLMLSISGGSLEGRDHTGLEEREL